MVGTSISHYKVLEKIGEGGMSVVYEAGLPFGSLLWIAPFRSAAPPFLGRSNRRELSPPKT